MRTLLIASAAGLGLSLMAFGAQAGHGHGDKMFDKLDANGDGRVTEDEMTSRHQELLANADQDGDGALTKEEMKAYHKAKREERRAARNPDKNDDGVIDRTEFITAAQEKFDKLDKNGDGVLSEDERPHRRGHHRRKSD